MHQVQNGRVTEVRRIWDVPAGVKTVHLCACTPEHAEEIGEQLEAAGIVWWVKAPSSGFLTFLERDANLFVDRERLAGARGTAGAPRGPGEGCPEAAPPVRHNRRRRGRGGARRGARAPR